MKRVALPTAALAVAALTITFAPNMASATTAAPLKGAGSCQNMTCF